MRSKFAIITVAGLVLSMAGLTSAQNTDTNRGNNKSNEDYAKKAEPVLKEHLSMVRAMDTHMATGMATPNARVDQ